MKADRTAQLSPAGGSPLAWHLPAAAISPADLDTALSALEQFEASNLRVRWRELFDHNAPARLGTDLLRRAIA